MTLLAIACLRRLPVGLPIGLAILAGGLITLFEKEILLVAIVLASFLPGLDGKGENKKRRKHGFASYCNRKPRPTSCRNEEAWLAGLAGLTTLRQEAILLLHKK